MLLTHFSFPNVVFPASGITNGHNRWTGYVSAIGFHRRRPRHSPEQLFKFEYESSDCRFYPVCSVTVFVADFSVSVVHRLKRLQQPIKKSKPRLLVSCVCVRVRRNGDERPRNEAEIFQRQTARTSSTVSGHRWFWVVVGRSRLLGFAACSGLPGPDGCRCSSSFSDFRP
jgi:hypothetical protein